MLTLALTTCARSASCCLHSCCPSEEDETVGRHLENPQSSNYSASSSSCLYRSVGCCHFLTEFHSWQKPILRVFAHLLVVLVERQSTIVTYSAIFSDIDPMFTFTSIFLHSIVNVLILRKHQYLFCFLPYHYNNPFLFFQLQFTYSLLLSILGRKIEDHYNGKSYFCLCWQEMMVIGIIHAESIIQIR